MEQWFRYLWNDFPTWKVVLVHLPVVPSEEMEQWFHHQKTDSADGVREGIVRGTWGHGIFSEYSPKQPNRAHTCDSRYGTPRTGYRAGAAGL